MILSAHYTIISSHIPFLPEKSQSSWNGYLTIATNINHILKAYPVAAIVMVLVTLVKDMATYSQDHKNNIYLKIWSDRCKLAFLLITVLVFIRAV
ncbi:hypothetical protein [Commensalibacter nepenthis]|uniref:Uncharacterized protein n=1 Tax=Commensalibacter nepenthis TaxID=3043872 RepID=A0ABT6Q8Q4_9PROT|nr:hypothetical protein [Commensalibacter sp. TBRC 10068]MDI2113282.1 hypothetical protein [Commensalibacter sp. TBRC 10068]